MQVSLFQVRRAKKKPFHLREFIYTMSEIARTLGVSEMSVYRYRRDFPLKSCCNKLGQNIRNPETAGTITIRNEKGGGSYEGAREDVSTDWQDIGD